MNIYKKADVADDIACIYLPFQSPVSILTGFKTNGQLLWKKMTN